MLSTKHIDYMILSSQYMLLGFSTNSFTVEVQGTKNHHFHNGTWLHFLRLQVLQFVRTNDQLDTCRFGFGSCFIKRINMSLYHLLL